jgi:hydroxymethylpyrimidine/phosphomethylpyrimidine kinase
MQAADVLTPNLDEAELLTGMSVRDLSQMAEAGRALIEAGAKGVVVTGGHLEEAVDLLCYQEAGEFRKKEFGSPRLVSNCTHGTGCAFSCSLACWLARGEVLALAVEKAKGYVTEAIREAYAIGHGMGPVNHMHGKR